MHRTYSHHLASELVSNQHPTTRCSLNICWRSLYNRLANFPWLYTDRRAVIIYWHKGVFSYTGLEPMQTTVLTALTFLIGLVWIAGCIKACQSRMLGAGPLPRTRKPSRQRIQVFQGSREGRDEKGLTFLRKSGQVDVGSQLSDDMSYRQDEEAELLRNKTALEIAVHKRASLLSLNCAVRLS